MADFSITVTDFPGEFGKTLTIPLEEDAKRPLTPHLRGKLRPSEPFPVMLSAAISAAERHMHIYRKTDNEVELVEQWLNLLRWEVKTFWKVDHTQRAIDENDASNLYVTWEHRKRSGELLAEGIAVRFIERRLGIPRDRIRFVPGHEARPDFVVLKAASTTGTLYGIEVRWRHKLTVLGDEDYTDLVNKKTSTVASRFIAVYVGYGRKSPVEEVVYTKVILADPPATGSKLTQLELADLVLDHYLGVTSRIGLWKYHARLQEMRSSVTSGRMPVRRTGLRDLEGTLRYLPKRPRPARTYVGRYFSSLEVEKRNGRLTKRQAQALFRRNDFGLLIFHGLHRDMLRFIETYDVRGMIRFYDNGSRGESANPVITADGVYRDTAHVTDSNSEDATEIVATVLTGRWPT